MGHVIAPCRGSIIDFPLTLSRVHEAELLRGQRLPYFSGVFSVDLLSHR